jgi:urea carboxylase-associated protein 1
MWGARGGVMLKESNLLAEDAISRCLVGAGDFFFEKLRKGQILRIVDVEGNQAADTLFYNASDISERYSAVDTVRTQGNIYLEAGTRLISTESRVMLEIVADTVGRHDTLGGACASESNTVRYDLERRHMHSCRDNWMLALALNEKFGLTKRDITHNINFFMNVPVTPEGGLDFADGLSGPGKYVEMRAEMDVFVLISNCPQLNNPCSGYNPTPLEILVWNTA